MNNIPFDSRDLSLILAIKPFLTPQGQKTIDGFISILEVLGRPAETSSKEKPDAQAVTSLIRLLSEE